MKRTPISFLRSCTVLAISSTAFFSLPNKISDGGTPNRVGDVVFFDLHGDEALDHVGIVEKVNLDGSIDAIEGNTSVGNDSNAGEVMHCNRRQSLILGLDHLIQITLSNKLSWR